MPFLRKYNQYSRDQRQENNAFVKGESQGICTRVSLLREYKFWLGNQMLLRGQNQLVWWFIRLHWLTDFVASSLYERFYLSARIPMIVRSDTRNSTSVQKVKLGRPSSYISLSRTLNIQKRDIIALMKKELPWAYNNNNIYEYEIQNLKEWNHMKINEIDL